MSELRVGKRSFIFFSSNQSWVSSRKWVRSFIKEKKTSSLYVVTRY
jgi:hypothetical protein